MRVYVGERDNLAEAIVSAALQHDMAGATIFRGAEGYGAHHRLHAAHPFSLSEDLPVVVELVDRPDKIDAFLPVLERMMTGGLITTQQVRMQLFGHGA